VRKESYKIAEEASKKEKSKSLCSLQGINEKEEISMDSEIIQFLKFIFGFYLFSCFLIVNYIFYEAYMSPMKIVVVDINSFGEADIEIAMVIAALAIGSALLLNYARIIKLKKN